MEIKTYQLTVQPPKHGIPSSSTSGTQQTPTKVITATPLTTSTTNRLPQTLSTSPQTVSTGGPTPIPTSNAFSVKSNILNLLGLIFLCFVRV
uniref:Uncharacterized protein n=1 Tax=Acrobeloides nanus TaxID=290746 RepID=A0A914E715_9BILA